METNLLVPQKNVAVATVNLKDGNLSLTDAATFEKLLNLEQEFTRLEGISNVDSLLSAQVIKSEADDIVVSSIIPRNRKKVTPDFLKSLQSAIPRYPELQPYINSGMDTLLFYVYFGNNTATADIESQLKKPSAEIQ